jgi:hypothetical protein
MNKIISGKMTSADLEIRVSLSGPRLSVPNPVLTTLRYFRDEYEATIRL